MGSLCGQVNIARRMNRSAVILFLFPPRLKADCPENEGRHKNAKPRTNQGGIFSLGQVSVIPQQWPPIYDQHPNGCY